MKSVMVHLGTSSYFAHTSFQCLFSFAYDVHDGSDDGDENHLIITSNIMVVMTVFVILTVMTCSYDDLMKPFWWLVK